MLRKVKKMTVKYIQSIYLGNKIEFTPSGHVDMDIFDEDGDYEKTTLAVFHDEEIEKLCKPIIKNYIKNLDKDSDIDLEIEKSDEENVDIDFFWEEICPQWDFENDTDVKGEKFKWDSESVYKKQIPRKEDFVKACINLINGDMKCYFDDRYDGITDLEYIEQLNENILKIRELYNKLYYVYETYEEQEKQIDKNINTLCT